VEPAFELCAGLVAVAEVGLIVQRMFGDVARTCIVAAALVGGGYEIAGVGANMVAEPVLGFRYYGPIRGRIIEIDR
jgi:competence protein ComEC